MMAKLKLAATLSVPLIVRLHVFVLPVQPPDHPPKIMKGLLVFGVSVNATCVPKAKFAVHVPGQLIPAGLLVTVPVLCPPTVTVSDCIARAKVADAVVVEFTVKVQDWLPPLQAPPQP